jgi:hypothetical protein
MISNPIYIYIYIYGIYTLHSLDSDKCKLPSLKAISMLCYVMLCYVMLCMYICMYTSFCTRKEKGIEINLPRHVKVHFKSYDMPTGTSQDLLVYILNCLCSNWSYDKQRTILYNGTVFV